MARKKKNPRPQQAIDKAPEPRWREGTLFRASFLALAALTVLPLWATRYLPMVDLPQHLGLISILHRLHEPGTRFSEFFAVRPGFTPYLGYYWLVHLVGSIVPIEWANRLVLTAWALGVPLATLGLVRALGRSDWLALFAFPLCYTYDFYMGFLNYLVAVALLLASLALYAARLQGRLAGWKWDVALAALPLLCVATHAQPYSFFVAALVVMLAAFSAQRLRTLALAAPSLAVFVWWLVTQSSGGATLPMSARAIFQPMRWRVDNFSRFALNNFKDSVDLALFLGLAAVWAWGLATALRKPADGRSKLGARLVAPLLAAGAVGGYFFMPTELPPTLYTISPRYATLTCLFLAVALPLVSLPRGWRAALVALCAAHAIYVLVQFKRFDAEAGDFRALAEKVEEQSCVATIAGYFPSSLHNEEQLYNHFASYLTLWRGAIPSYTFAGVPHSPLAYKRKDGALADGFRDAAFLAFTPSTERQLVRQGQLYPALGKFYRYFLVGARFPLESLFGPYAAQLELVGEAGPLRLYKNAAGNCRG